jgi:Na+/phosphate symporter
MMPEGEEGGEPAFDLNYLDESMLKTPVMALSLAKKETVRMAEVVHEMVSTILPVFLDKDPAATRRY